MTLQGPSASELQDLARSLGFGLTDGEAGEYSALLAPLVGMADAQQKMPDCLPEVKYPRTPGYRPDGEENRYNAWYYKSRVEGAPDGRLKGKTVALKDNVMLAGVPMMNGTSILEGYVPEVDATIVTRLLDAGATILGKAHCENYCLSGSSHTNATGPCHNPHRMGYSAGGSSSGSAALVAAGEVDMAIGGDQGGSIRMPASFCGVYGMKPTYGLVPYTGVLGIEAAIDHVGPMTATVADNASMLEAIAGPDGIDGRQRDVVTHPYSEMLDGGVSGLRIAVIEDGFDHPRSQPESDAVVRAACARFGELGAEVET
ncbi:MAG: amidase family protein, partial [Defluviicoccus sp.]|nr:amidase family protein [Defluviicoccus sp.]